MYNHRNEKKFEIFFNYFKYNKTFTGSNFDTFQKTGGGGVNNAVKKFYTLQEKINIYKKV